MIYLSLSLSLYIYIYISYIRHRVFLHGSVTNCSLPPVHFPTPVHIPTAHLPTLPPAVATSCMQLVLRGPPPPTSNSWQLLATPANTFLQ